MEMYEKQHCEVLVRRAQEVAKPTDTKNSAARTIVAGEFVYGRPNGSLRLNSRSISIAGIGCGGSSKGICGHRSSRR